jgi:hypothetical protein
MKKKIVGGPGKETLITKTGRILDITGWDPANFCEQCALVDAEARPCAAIDVPLNRVKVANVILKDFGLLSTITPLSHVALFHVFKFPHLKWVIAEIAKAEPFSLWQSWLEGHLYGYSEHTIAGYLTALAKDKKREKRSQKSKKK